MARQAGGLQPGRCIQVHHERLRRLRELDAATKIPFIMVELVGNGNKASRCVMAFKYFLAVPILLRIASESGEAGRLERRGSSFLTPQPEPKASQKLVFCIGSAHML
eukprot:808943-Amphidinium_carterae.1